ncbi:hypothetical protein ACFQZK_00425 [Rhodococcus aetherivorans]
MADTTDQQVPGIERVDGQSTDSTRQAEDGRWCEYLPRDTRIQRAHHADPRMRIRRQVRLTSTAVERVRLLRIKGK